MSRGSDHPSDVPIADTPNAHTVRISRSRAPETPLPRESSVSTPPKDRTAAGAEGQTPHFPRASSVATTLKAHLRGAVHPFGTTDKETRSKQSPLVSTHQSARGNITPKAHAGTHAQGKDRERGRWSSVEAKRPGQPLGKNTSVQVDARMVIRGGVPGQHARGFLIESGAVDLRTHKKQYGSWHAAKPNWVRITHRTRKTRSDVSASRYLHEHVEPTPRRRG